MCESERECETSTSKQSGMNRVEKLMNALVGWLVLTACKRIRIRMLMKSFAQEREMARGWAANLNCRATAHTHTCERKLFASIHHFEWTPSLSFRMPTAICLHCTPTICLPFHWHCGFPKLKSCAKSANNACDISLKIPPKKPMRWLTFATKIAMIWFSNEIQFWLSLVCCRINVFCCICCSHNKKEIKAHKTRR